MCHRSRPESRECDSFNRIKDYLDKKFQSMKEEMNAPLLKKRKVTN